MKKHVVFNSSTLKIVYVGREPLPNGFRVEDPELGFFEFEGSEVPVSYSLQTVDGSVVMIETPRDLSPQKWLEIRAERSKRLNEEVDSKEKYLIHGDLPSEEVAAIRAHRIALLNVPQDIEAKIASGEIASVMDVNIETYPWPVLGQ